MKTNYLMMSLREFLALLVLYYSYDVVLTTLERLHPLVKGK